MTITRETLDKIAHLARLEFSEAEAESMLNDMGKIVSWVEKLREVDTTGVEPLTSMSDEHDVFRTDEYTESPPVEEALRHAPAPEEGRFFSVPKVIE